MNVNYIYTCQSGRVVIFQRCEFCLSHTLYHQTEVTCSFFHQNGNSESQLLLGSLANVDKACESTRFGFFKVGVG